MRCPFLREAQVKSCQASAFRKMIVRSADDVSHEKCSTSEYMSCPAAKQLHEEIPNRERCPFLQESLMQYCSAAPVPKYIPYSESLLSRCGNDSHRYCEVFLGLAQPESAGTNNSTSCAVVSQTCERENGSWVEGIFVPSSLAFSSNHLWLDLSEDGYCCIGIDAFLSRVLGRAERVSFATVRGRVMPAAVLSVQGIDLQVVFPLTIILTKVNTYLRVNSEHLTGKPYNRGWLFEGILPKSAENEKRCSDEFVRGNIAVEWMADEVRRLSEFVHEHFIPARDTLGAVMNDGGVFCENLAKHLTREELLHLFNEFFSPYISRR